MTDIEATDFALIADLIREHATARPDHRALDDGQQTLSYARLNQLMDRVATRLQRLGLLPGEAVAICATTSVSYAAVYLGALRAGVVVAPLAPGSTPEALAGMMADAQAKIVFTDAASCVALGEQVPGAPPRVALDDSAPGEPLSAWLAEADARPAPAHVTPAAPFNIIYSSGTTGTPKGIVQPHGMRWAHVRRGIRYGYGAETVTLLSTPLYSNTTLVVFFPTLAFGGTVLLMPRFDAAGYLALAEREKMTHTMLVPVQYMRLLARPEFDQADLSSTKAKFCTSAPFSAEVKREVLQRWPGPLIEFYGMTEGGGTCILEAHLYPDKLHTVGRPAEGHDIRLIDDEGLELPPGSTGEVVGHSSSMMKGYHGQPEKTRDAEWFDPSGKRFIRTGDVGRFDEDGFLTLMDRKKDMIISGGFNIYPSDLEALLRTHPAVQEAAVVGVPSTQWGETPVAFVVLQAEQAIDEAALRQWLNERVGKTQRLADLLTVTELPRSPIGKILKRELRDGYVSSTSKG